MEIGSEANPTETLSGMLSWICPEKEALHPPASLRWEDVNLSSSWPQRPLLPGNDVGAEKAENRYEASPETRYAHLNQAVPEIHILSDVSCTDTFSPHDPPSLFKDL